MSHNQPPAASAAPRELRLALAMRGGVSLAVWIGGTCCEIDRLRTAGRAQGSGNGCSRRRATMQWRWTSWLVPAPEG